jgi:dynein heavy chain
MYECPSYVTSQRGPTYVFTAYLQMESEESDPNKWILAGVALLMSPEWLTGTPKSYYFDLVS